MQKKTDKKEDKRKSKQTKQKNVNIKENNKKINVNVKEHKEKTSILERVRFKTVMAHSPVLTPPWPGVGDMGVVTKSPPDQ